MPQTHSDFIAYYNEYKNKVYSFLLYRLNGHEAVAEDLTSDTFVKAYEKFETFDTGYKFSTWIYTIARNVLIDYIRTTKQTFDLDTAEHKEDETLSHDETKQSVDTELSMKRLERALVALPAFQKDCIILKYLDDMTTKEIAEITNQSEANVRQAVSRGIRTLRQKKLFFMFILTLTSLLSVL